MRPTRSLFLLTLAGIFVLAGASCSTTRASADAGMLRLDPEAKEWVADDGAKFPVDFQVPDKGRPKVIVVGVHGLSGSTKDLELLGKALQAKGMGLLAYALRSQGDDPEKRRLGDMRSSDRWVRDMREFDTLVRAMYPGTPVVWLGESLGSMIVSHAAVEKGAVLPVGIVLVSPIPGFGGKVAPWQRKSLALAAAFAPRYHVPLTAWAPEGDAAWKTTGSTDHISQLEKTPWAVNTFTLRFYRELGDLVDGMPGVAPKLTPPVLVLHSGHDPLADADAVDAFAALIPQSEVKHYKDSRHLLFYDKDREKVVRDIADWVARVGSVKK